MIDKELSALKALAEAVPQENWERDGRTVYALQHAGWRKGMEQLENRFYFSVQPGRGMSEGDAEAIAELIAATNPAAILSLISRVERAECALIRDGYEDIGGKEWKPPIGEPPRFIEVATPACDVVGLTEPLCAVRRLIDGSQPKDIPGAIMVIDSVIAGRSWTYDISPPPGFIDYVKSNYTGDVFFDDPEWHALRLWNAAMRNVSIATSPAPSVKQEQSATISGVSGFYIEDNCGDTEI